MLINAISNILTTNSIGISCLSIRETERVDNVLVTYKIP